MASNFMRPAILVAIALGLGACTSYGDGRGYGRCRIICSRRRIGAVRSQSPGGLRLSGGGFLGRWLDRLSRWSDGRRGWERF